ncbi:uncharacterized protein LOC129573493, partial [Sitodiplosis mosellana]|uniref:uncharacterized protein LOC129573493 n=1 Tax=Sitodiplosis mosellana TaxID=263140 RepID=UPI00244446CD
MAYLDDWHKTPVASHETYESLRLIIDNSKRAIRQLKVIGSPVDHWDHIFIYGISTRMPPRTVTAWETTYDLKDMPTLAEVWEFLEKRARGLLYSSNTSNQEKSSKGQFSQQKPNTSSQPPKQMSSSKSNGKAVECYNCKGAHTIASSQSCKSGTCQRCNRGLKHNRLLCNTNVMTSRAIKFDMPSGTSTSQGTMTSNQEPHATPLDEQQRQSASKFLVSQGQRAPILTTACVKLHGNNGTTMLVRVLFDSGSEGDIITEKCANRANLLKTNFSIEVEGITGSEIIDYGAVVIKLSAWFDESDEILIKRQCIIMKKLPIARKTECASDIPAFRSITKADPNFHKAGYADILLGINTWSDVVMNHLLWSGEGLCAQLTRFGYAIFGSVEVQQKPIKKLVITKVNVNESESQRLDEILRRFWEEEEESDVERMFSADELKAEEFYKATTKRAKDGRFIVRLPMTNEIQLGDSREIAYRRFMQLERRLEYDANLREKYHQAMRDLLSS